MVKQEVRKTEDVVSIEEYGKIPKKVRAGVGTGTLPYIEELAKMREWSNGLPRIRSDAGYSRADDVGEFFDDELYVDQNGAVVRNVAMAVLPILLPNMFELSEHWLVDTGTCEDLCPSFEKGDDNKKRIRVASPEDIAGEMMARTPFATIYDVHATFA